MARALGTTGFILQRPQDLPRPTAETIRVLLEDLCIPSLNEVDF